MPRGLAYHGVTSANNNVFTLGGWDEDWEIVNYVFKYNINKDSWTINSILPQRMGEVSVTSVNGTIYLAGGTLPDTTTRNNKVYKYIINEEIEETICLTDWQCTSWSSCEGGLKTRSCEKKEPSCEAGPRPSEAESCTITPTSSGSAVSVSRGINRQIEETQIIEEEIIEETNKTNETEIKPVLFDIYLESVNKLVKQGKNLDLILGLINLGLPGQVEARVEYTIKNSQNYIIYEEKESLMIETQSEFLKSINTEHLEPGTYTVFVNLEYEGQTEPAQAKIEFVVEQDNKLINNKTRTILLNIFLALTITITLILLNFFRYINLPQKKP